MLGEARSWGLVMVIVVVGVVVMVAVSGWGPDGAVAVVAAGAEVVVVAVVAVVAEVAVAVVVIAVAAMAVFPAVVAVAMVVEHGRRGGLWIGEKKKKFVKKASLKVMKEG